MTYFVCALILFTSSITYSSLPYMPGFPDYKPVSENISFEETTTQNAYPDVNVSGFIEMKLSGRDYNDDLNKLETIRNDEYYKKLPNNVLKGSPKLENRYNITAEGKLDDETSVDFEIIKEPDFPLIGNVLVKKNKSELQLGNFNSTYNSGDYINVDKYLNGVEARTKQNHWTGKTTIAKEKSEPQLYETFGNDSKIYKVGKSFLLEGSVRVYVNNKRLSENIDYTINYYEGKITFTNILTKTDYLKVIYEFTNPIQDFIPALSRKNFTAGSYTYNPSQNIVINEFVVVTKNETFIINNESNLESNRISLTHYPVELGSELVYFNSQLLTRGIHYFIKNDTGLIRFTGKVLNLDDEINVEYKYFKTNKEQELFFGDNTPGPYHLKHQHILEDTLKISLNGMEAREFIDYLFKQNTSTIEFLYPIYTNKVFKVNYTYKESIEKSTDFKEAPYSVSVTYLNESTVVRKGEALFIENEVGNVSGNILTLQNNPIDPNKPFQIFNDGEEVDNSTYTVNSYEGTVSFNSISSLNNITSSYYYIDSILTEYSFRGNGQQIYSQENNDLKFQSWPIQYNGIDEIRMYNDEFDDGILLDPNSDYNIVYSNDGSQLTNITIIFTPTNPGGQLTEYPTTRDTLKVKYFFTPSGDETKSDSSHEMIDVRAKKRINKNWEIYTEIAKSKYNFSKTSKFNQETFQTAQENNKYLLAQSPIEENSELVFINGVSQTRGRDYYISYENGTVTLINKSITDGVTVEISYNYFLTDTPNINDVNAYVVESVFNPNDKIEIINKYNYVDPNFIPIGNININKGSSKIYNELNWQMSQNEYISFFYENEDIQNSDYNTMYTKDSYVTKLKFYSLVFDTEHEIRFDDIQSSQNFKETPKKIIEYKNDITYFDDNDQLTLNSAFSQQNESISNENQLNSFSAGSKLTYVNNFKNKYGIEKGFFSPFYGFKVDKTNSKTNNNYNQKTIESYGFSSNAQLNDHITNNTNFEKSIYNTSFINNESYLDEYYNYANHAFFSPYNWINTSFVINHDETISPIPGQEDKVEDRQSYNIIQLSNKAGLEYIKAPKLIQGLFSGSNTSAGYLKTKRRENNQLKNYNEDRVYGNLTRFTPFEGFNIPTIKYDAYQSSFSNRAETSYQKESYSTSDFYSIVSNFTYKPNINYLRHISYDGNIKQSNSSTIGDLELVSGTQNLTETTIYNDQKMIGVNITPPKIPLIITNINNLIIRLERNWLKKTDQNITDSFNSDGNLFDNINSINNSDINADKLKTSYRLFNYFNLSNNALNESSFFNRNQYTDSTGSLYKTKQNVDQAVGWNFFAIKNTEYLKYEVINQYQNSNINVFPDNITSNYDSYLNLEQREVSHESKLKISRLISISGKLDGQDFNQFIASKNIADETDYFRQIKGSTGITVTPLSGLNIGYDYSIKQLHSDDYNNVTGYQDVFSIIYNPIKYENFELQFKFTLDRNWGFGFNTIEQTQLLQTNNELTSIDIISRDDEVYLSSLNLNIKLPINNSEHLESVTLTGEGYFKKIIDKFNPENELTINGFLFNLRLEL